MIPHAIQLTLALRAAARVIHDALDHPGPFETCTRLRCLETRLLLESKDDAAPDASASDAK